MITPQTFRLDYPVFANQAIYDDAAINFWTQIGLMLMNVTVPQIGGAQTSGLTVVGGVVLNFSPIPGFIQLGMSLADVTTPNVIPSTATVINLNPITISQPVVGATGVKAGDIIFFSGGQLSSTRWGQGSALPTSPPTTLLDAFLELFVAHNLALEKRARDTAQNPSPPTPGQVIGPIASKSVGSVSISYDASAGLEPDAGHWNQTTYGTRFIKMARFKGSGGIQIGVGIAPPFSTFGASGGWIGPWPWPQQGDVGF